MSRANPKCRRCNAKLVIGKNWYECTAELNGYICNNCAREYGKQRWRNTHEACPNDYPIIKKKDCASYLGCYVAERVLSNIFKDVIRMPFNNPGFDFICNHGKKIDVKSSCLRKRRNKWTFNITHNKIAEYFLCIAFDNREDLNPLHLWLIPGYVINHKSSVCVSKSVIEKWDKFALEIGEVVTCCSTLKEIENR